MTAQRSVLLDLPVIKCHVRLRIENIIIILNVVTAVQALTGYVHSGALRELADGSYVG